MVMPLESPNRSPVQVSEPTIKVYALAKTGPSTRGACSFPQVLNLREGDTLCAFRDQRQKDSLIRSVLPVAAQHPAKVLPGNLSHASHFTC